MLGGGSNTVKTPPETVSVADLLESAESMEAFLRVARVALGE